MLKVKRSRLLVILALIMLFGLLVTTQIFAAPGYSPQPQKAPEVPLDWLSLPPVTELRPDPTSEVKLDEVTLIIHPNATGRTLYFGGTLAADEEPSDYIIKINPQNKTYKTMKVPRTKD